MLGLTQFNITKGFEEGEKEKEKLPEWTDLEDFKKAANKKRKKIHKEFLQ